MEHSAGIVIIYDNKILLVHHTGHSFQYGYGIPKGHIENNETIKDAAIRETEEEVGIKIKPNQLNNKTYRLHYKKAGEIYKIVDYFVLHIKNLSEIGLSNTVIPKNQLQVNETDWAGFMEISDAKKKIFRVMKDCLKHLNENLFTLKNFKTFNE